MRSLNEQRSAGEGRELGWAKAGWRLSTGRWRGAEALGKSLQTDFRTPPLQESLFSLGQRWVASVNPTGLSVFALGDQFHQD